MRDRSEHDPRTSDHDPTMIRPRQRKTEPAAPPRLLFALARSRFYWKLQRFPLRLSFQISPHAAPATKSDTWTSPNAAPATQNESHDWSASHETFTMRGATGMHPANTKYCVPQHECHDWSAHKWNCHNAQQKVTHELHQMLRLPRKIAFPNLREIYWKQLKWHFQCATDPSMIRDRSENDPTQKTQTATRRATEATFRTRQEQILLKITTFPAPAIIPNFTTCCACHEKWHMNFTKCCACHEKWHMNSTKCCACQEKWHMNSTKCCACHEKWHEVTHCHYYDYDYCYYYYYSY